MIDAVPHARLERGPREPQDHPGLTALRVVERLRHYFETYKMVPERPRTASVEHVYGRAHALKVVQAAIDDYTETFGSVR